jgi:hypothetical protein
LLRSVIALLSAATVLAVHSPSALRLHHAGTPRSEDVSQIRIPTQSGRPKIVYSFNPDDDLAAIRRAGFTHVLVSYLQNMPDAEQRRRLDAFQRAGLKLIYRIVDLVDRARRTGNDSLVQHTVLLLRDHPALAGW